jgi:CHAT domain-containing protein
MVTRRTASLILAAALSWTGSHSAFAAEAAQTPAPAPITFPNLAGESCGLTMRTDVAPDPAAPPPVFLSCDGGKHDSGAIALIPMPLDLPPETDVRHDVMVKTAAASPAGREAASRMACRDGHWITIGEQEVFAEHCTLIDGSWIYVQLTTQVGGYLAQIEGLPVNVTALAAASSKLANVPAIPLSEPDKAKALLSDLFAGKPPMVASGELDRFSALAEQARIANSRSDYRAAEDDYRQSMLILERAQSPDSPGVGKLLMELALEVSNQGRPEEAAALFRRADPIVQRSVNPADRPRFNNYLGYDAANSGRYADALSYARTATNQWRTLIEKNTPDYEAVATDSRPVWRGELAHSLNALAAMALRTGDLAEAETSAKEALDIIGNDNNLPPWWKPEVLVTLGRVYSAAGRLNEAETAFRGALVFQQRLFGQTAPTASTLLALSGVYADQEFYPDSLRAYDAAMKILAQDELARSSIVFDQVAPALVAASAVAAHSPDKRAEMEEKMFQALQLLSGGVADQTIAKASLRLAAQNPAMEKLVHDAQESDRQRDAARIELAHETSLPDEQRGSDKENTLLNRINAFTAERDQALKKLADEFPAYADLQHSKPVELAAAQARLQPNEAMLAFEIGRTRSFVVLVTKDRLIAQPLQIDQIQVETAVRALRKAFTTRGGRLDEFDLTQAHALYQRLFGPIEGSLAGIDQLVLVQTGALASLPAALLVTADPGKDTDYRHAAWLARRFATLEVPSIRAFASLRDRAATHQEAAKPFFGIGNPPFTGGTDDGKGRTGLSAMDSACRDGGPFPAEQLRALAPLPDTATELRTVAKSLGADDDSLLLGAAATEKNLRARNLRDVRVLYFATHALLPGELSCQSEPALALAPPATPATDRSGDGLLDASEVAGLTLNADLVVLSACNTGQTETQFGGAALAGLAESFFYAGARSLIASHWQVPSSATAQLMVGMFGRLTADPGAGTARAIRGAQLALIDKPETAHPFFWAAFTLIGDAGVPAKSASTALLETAK